jgi:hypothetical protein
MKETTPPTPSPLWPRTFWRKLYVAWFVICFLMVWLGTWAVNRPVPVFGLPLVYVWCSAWGVLGLAGCLYCGLRIEREPKRTANNNSPLPLAGEGQGVRGE